MLLSGIILKTFSDTSKQIKVYSPWPLQIETPNFELQV